MASISPERVSTKVKKGALPKCPEGTPSSPLSSMVGMQIFMALSSHLVWWELSNDQGPSVHQHPDHRFPSRLQKTLDRASRDTHTLPGARLVEPFQVAEAQRLQLIFPEDQKLKIRHGNTTGLEDPVSLVVPAAAVFSGTWHRTFINFRGERLH